MSPKRRSAVAALLTLTISLSAGAATDSLHTIAEQSDYKRTGRYEEVIALCATFAQRYPDAVHCERFGITPEGRPMQVLVVSRSGALTPAAAQQMEIPVVLIQGGIHAGEIDGKDAGFLALRELLEGKAAKGMLEKQVLLFVPVFNVDGHERFGRWNRPNQRGPEEMGWRTTAQNYNLNRDYVKADAPEMQAMLGLMNTWDPLATIDLHVTDGAQFEHDIAIMVEPGHSGDEHLRVAGRSFRDAVIARLAKQGSLPLAFYPSFDEYDNPASGFTDVVSPPRFSTGYLPLRNRFGMLVETHSWREYPHRVRITRNTIVAVLEQFAANGTQWLALARSADAAAMKLAGKSVPLEYLASDKVRTIDLRGYEYTRTPSEVSGALMIRYNENKPALWKIPLRDDVQPSLSVTAPRGGYLIPTAYAVTMAEKLALHGVSFRRLHAPLNRVDVESFRAEKTTFDAATVEGRQRLSVTGAWQGDKRDMAAGSLFVPIAQPRARLLMALLEPQAPDSLLAWGNFNHHFEQKEYMESYVAEAVAREMLANDPALKAEFERRINEDAAFAKDPAARLTFFHRRHSSWDERFNLYPVFRTTVVPGTPQASR